jgi:hypothetical protein
MKSLFKEFPVLSWLTVVLLLALTVLITDMITITPTYAHGKVVDKHYKAGSSNTRLVHKADKTTIMVTDTDTEAFLIMIRSKEGSIITAKSNSNLYYRKEIGDDVRYAANIGRIFGKVWSVRAVE